MKAYITTVGTSVEAVINPLWYLAEVYSWLPNMVYLLWNDDVREQLEKAKELITELSKTYGASVKVVAGENLRFNEENPTEFREKAGSLIDSLKSKGYEVVVDITPGRKFMSALLLSAAMSENADEVTYLHLDDLSYTGRLLFDVPMVKQKLFTTKELTGNKGFLRPRRFGKESSGSYFTTRRALMRVLNSLYLDGKTSFDVSLRSVPIGKVRLGEKTELKVSQRVHVNDTVHGDPSKVREAIVAGGMAKFRNWNELRKKVFSLLEDGRPLYVGFDTNALYFRVPSKILTENDFYRNGNLIFDFLYAKGVMDEVGRHLNKKLRYNTALGVFSNQPTPLARFATLGLVELQKLKSSGAELVDSGGNEEGDTRIALDYRSYAERKDVNVLVITLDDRAYAEMKALSGSGLIPFKLEWEDVFGKTLKGRWEDLRDTLYTLAVVLGELNFAHYKLYGVWKGKKTEDWETERLRLNGFEYGRLFGVFEGNS
ncbi:hypothetical protein [Thermococcus prieurii]